MLSSLGESSHGSSLACEPYPLVNVYITMENHHNYGKSPVMGMYPLVNIPKNIKNDGKSPVSMAKSTNFLWPFSIANCLFTRPGRCFFFWINATHTVGRCGLRGSKKRTGDDLMLLNKQLVGGLEHFLFFHILGIIIPTD